MIKADEQLGSRDEHMSSPEESGEKRHSIDLLADSLYDAVHLSATAALDDKRRCDQDSTWSHSRLRFLVPPTEQVNGGTGVTSSTGLLRMIIKNELDTDNTAPTSVLPALYYPYIHIRSEHWLKATLLTAQTVKRIVPENYTPEDEPKIVRYTTIAGPHRKLLQAVPSFTPAAHEAQFRLLQKLQEHAALIRTKYDHTDAPRGDEYWIQ
jgi:hypothetical protein